MEIIKIENLRYRYPESVAPALDSINLGIDQGDFLLLTGPSGGGKSTLLRIIGGMIPDFYGGKIEGDVDFSGISIFKSSKKLVRENIGMVFQNPESQIIMKRVESDLALGPENMGTTRSEIESRIQKTVKLLGLEEILDADTQKLSSGQKQKVAIASALSMNTKVLLLDEPTSQLDLESADRIFDILKTLKEKGHTIILGEQRLKKFLPIADRVVLMNGGRIVMDTDAASFVRKAPQKYPLALGFGTVRGFNKAAKQSTEIIQINDLNFRYEDSPPLLSNLNFKASRGEFISIIGKNGSGKSTLLKIISGILKPLNGKILIDGKPIEDINIKDKARFIGFLSQNPNDYLFNDTVEQELDYTVRNLGIGDASKIDEILEMLGLTEKRHSHPRDLSTGQRQRVALGSVLAGDPSLILLDEPTRGLDWASKKKLGELLGKFADNGRSVILVTQDLDFASAFSQRILMLAKGSLIEVNQASLKECEFLRGT